MARQFVFVKGWARAALTYRSIMEPLLKSLRSGDCVWHHSHLHKSFFFFFCRGARLSKRAGCLITENCFVQRLKWSHSACHHGGKLHATSATIGFAKERRSKLRAKSCQECGKWSNCTHVASIQFNSNFILDAPPTAFQVEPKPVLSPINKPKPTSLNLKFQSQTNINNNL